MLHRERNDADWCPRSYELLEAPRRLGDLFCSPHGGPLVFSRRVRWCNGSTRVFGALCPGSNPGRTANCRKLQAPSPKHQAGSWRNWNLELEACLEFGAWNLGQPLSDSGHEQTQPASRTLAKTL